MLLRCHPASVPIQHGLLSLRLQVDFDLLTVLNAKLQDLKRVLDEIVLDGVVELGVRTERGHVVHFEDPRFELMIQHHIEAEQVAAAVRLFGLCRPIEMLELWLHDKQCLDDNLLNLCPYLLGPLPEDLAFNFRAELTLQNVL